MLKKYWPGDVVCTSKIILFIEGENIETGEPVETKLDKWEHLTVKATDEDGNPVFEHNGVRFSLDPENLRE